MRTLAMSGRRGLSRTLLSTGTTTEAQVIRQLQHAVWQQVPRLLLPIEIDQGQGGGILKTTDQVQRRVNRCRFDEDNAMKFHAAMKAIPLGVAGLTARLVALLPLPAWALERLYINGSILTRAGERPSYVEALGVENGRIVFSGPRDRGLALRTASTRIIDLQGKALLPGFWQGCAEHPRRPEDVRLRARTEERANC
jgi:hypothetical protein